jgi:hypothetical protein
MEYTATPAPERQADLVLPQEQDPSQEPPISQSWKWMTVLGNAAIGACELAAGNISSLSVTADGLHNVGDTATYYMQAENIVNTDLSEERRQRLRKVAHYVIAASSLGVGMKAGYDLATDQEHLQNAAAIYTASASLALNGLMFARLRQGMRRKHGHASVHEKDLLKHFWAIDIPSAALAVTGAVLQKYNIHIEQVAAIASSAVGAIAFRPTKRNLAHNCLDHGHSHHHDDHAAHHQKRRGRHRYIGPSRKSDKNWLERMTYKPRHAKAAN